MTVIELTQSAQFVVGQDGKATAVIVDITAWEKLIALLEEIEDLKLVQERLQNWQTKEGWTTWEDFEAELVADELSPVD